MHLIPRSCIQNCKLVELVNCDLQALPTLSDALFCKQLIQAGKDGLNKRPIQQCPFGERHAFGDSLRMHCKESLRSWSVWGLLTPKKLPSRRWKLLEGSFFGCPQAVSIVHVPWVVRFSLCTRTSIQKIGINLYTCLKRRWTSLSRLSPVYGHGVFMDVHEISHSNEDEKSETDSNDGSLPCNFPTCDHECWDYWLLWLDPEDPDSTDEWIRWVSFVNQVLL